MAVLKSYDSADQLKIDGVSKAARVTVYDAAGNPVTGALTDTQLRASAVSVSHSGLTDTQLRAAAVSVTDTRLPAALDGDGGVKAHIQNTVTVSGPLTDTQLRASAVPVSLVTQPLPTGASTEASLSTRLSESDFDSKTGALTETAPASDTASSGVNGRLQRIAQRLTSLIGLLPTSLGQKTKANSLAVTLASDTDILAVSGPLTDTQLRAAAVPTTITNFPGSQAVTGPLTDTQLRASAVPVYGSFFQATQPVSGPLTDTQLRASAVAVTGPLTDAQLRASAVSVSGFPSLQPVAHVPATQASSVTGVAGAGVTLTTLFGPGLFQYLTFIEVALYNTAVRTGGATPVVVTTTNLNGVALTFGSAGAIGTIERQVIAPDVVTKTQTANTALTIVCPATASVIWRVNVLYYVAA